MYPMASYLNVQIKLINCKIKYLLPFYLGKHTFIMQNSGAGLRILRIPGVLQQLRQQGRAAPVPGPFPFTACSTRHYKVMCLCLCGNPNSNIQPSIFSPACFSTHWALEHTQHARRQGPGELWRQAQSLLCRRFWSPWNPEHVLEGGSWDPGGRVSWYPQTPCLEQKGMTRRGPFCAGWGPTCHWGRVLRRHRRKSVSDSLCSS